MVFNQSSYYSLLASGMNCSLRSLQLQNNTLGGQLGTSLTDLVALAYLGLGSNQITGP